MLYIAAGCRLIAVRVMAWSSALLQILCCLMVALCLWQGQRFEPQIQGYYKTAAVTEPLLGSQNVAQHKWLCHYPCDYDTKPAAMYNMGVMCVLISLCLLSTLNSLLLHSMQLYFYLSASFNSAVTGRSGPRWCHAGSPIDAFHIHLGAWKPSSWCF